MNFLIKNSRKTHVLISLGILAYAFQADFTRCLDTTSKQESQGCVRFARKIYVMPAKIPELVLLKQQ